MQSQACLGQPMQSVVTSLFQTCTVSIDVQRYEAAGGNEGMVKVNVVSGSGGEQTKESTCFPTTAEHDRPQVYPYVHLATLS